jgi:hypothetical protein
MKSVTASEACSSDVSNTASFPVPEVGRIDLEPLSWRSEVPVLEFTVTKRKGLSNDALALVR